MGFRGMVPIMLATVVAGCGQYGTSGPDDLGMQQLFTPEALQASFTLRQPIHLNAAAQRNAELSKWIVRSDYLCNKYLLEISRGIRTSKVATDAIATILSGLATILAPVGTKTALSGAATITLGVGSDIQSDLFAQQASDVVSTAIQTIRTRARTALQEKWQKASYDAYTLEQGLVDVQRYDQETCNLNVGLSELRMSLIAGPGTKRPNDPILPAPSAPPATLTPAAIAPPIPIVESLPPIPPPPEPHRPPASQSTANQGAALGPTTPDDLAGLTLEQQSQIQRSLCIPTHLLSPRGIGGTGSIARQALRNYKARIKGEQNPSQILTEDLKKELLNPATAATCPADKDMLANFAGALRGNPLQLSDGRILSIGGNTAAGLATRDGKVTGVVQVVVCYPRQNLPTGPTPTAADIRQQLRDRVKTVSPDAAAAIKDDTSIQLVAPDGTEIVASGTNIPQCAGRSRRAS